MPKIKPLIAVLLLFLFIFPVTAGAAGSSLIENGDFSKINSKKDLPESWFVEAWFWDNESVLVDTAESDLGGSCVHIFNLTENDARLSQKIKVEPNTYYRLSCQIKTKGIESGAGANISASNSIATSDGVFGDTTQWQTVELVGLTGKDQRELTVSVRIGGFGQLSYGEAWFDNVEVEALEEEPAVFSDFSTAKTDNAGANDNDDGESVPYMGAILLSSLATAAAFAFLYRSKWLKKEQLSLGAGKTKATSGLWIILGAALVLRILLSLIFYGHLSDIGCFMGWAQAMADKGPGQFYTSGMFADYPPGYMYILWLLGGAANLFGIAGRSDAYALLVKLPSIAADLAVAYLVYKFARKRFSESTSLMLCGVIAFNPFIAFVSGGWGQIDMLLTLFILLVIYLFLRRKYILAGAVLGFAILLKPQALIFAPIMAVAYIMYIKDGRLKALRDTALAVAAAVAVIFLFSLPFKSTQEWTWIIERYTSTTTSYQYASVEAFNLFALLGANWHSAKDVLFIFTYQQWGMIFIALSVVYSAVLYIKGRGKNPHALTLAAAFLIAGVFTLGHYMHERYLFPAVILLLFAYIAYGDKRLFLCFGGFSVSMLLNALAAFVIVQNQQARGAQYDLLTFIGSAITVAVFAYFTYVSTQLVFFPDKALSRGKPLPGPGIKKPDDAPEPRKRTAQEILPAPHDNKLRYTKKDWIFCIALTAVYAIISLVNLGTTQAPETAWKATARSEDVVLAFDETVTVNEIRVFGGLYEGTLKLTADDGLEITYEQINGGMFRWKSVSSTSMNMSQLTLSVESGRIWLNEIAFVGADGKFIVPRVAQAGDTDAEHLIDEPDQITDKPSYLNGMYFDELYHARTAYEHLNGIAPYENSHPPLGKVFIMLGIAVFGMNALGWRIVGALFGIAMVPILYAFAKRIFKRSDYALLAAGLFAFDFMHFTQTRIATIDVYGVFFILLMFYYMYQYYCMNFFVDGLRKTFKPLALAGLFFGLGAASKWICIYAGAGLAVILFASLFKRYKEYRECMESGDEALREKVKNYPRMVIQTLLWCCVFYIAVPVVIYTLSYLPYYLSESHYTVFGESNSMWSVQKFMFNYHSSLTATHSYEAPWFLWPLNLRPIWYYMGTHTAAGNVSTISAMGNPAVWWVCAVGMVMLLVRLIRGKTRMNKALFILLVGVGANFLPWVLVTRCTFIYHYFATVPFIILGTVYLLKEAEERNPRLSRLKWIWLGASVALFILFYPAISGLEVPGGYIRSLEWLPSWTFLGEGLPQWLMDAVNWVARALGMAS